jgi:hypothetical protein
VSVRKGAARPGPGVSSGPGVPVVASAPATPGPSLLRLLRPYAAYNEGETATFLAEEAAALISRGIAEPA